MKKSLKSLLACLLALALVIPAFGGVVADQKTQVKGTLEAIDSVRIDVSGIRNGRTFEAAEETASEELNPTDIVDIMVSIDTVAPAADVCSDLKAAGDYREELLASQKALVVDMGSKLGVEIDVMHNYTVLMNGFSFKGEYRLVEEINKMEGVHAFVAMEWESPELFNTTSQVGATAAWELDYSGEGTLVAIIDTGCKVDHPAFSVAPENVKLTRDNVASIIAGGQLNGSGSQMNVNNVYYSAKIPFRWNYVGNNANVAHAANTSDHGTHVAGIAAGNGGEIQGVAKDAQLAIMQVFSPSGGASWSNILPALEDTMVIGADSANLSLGRACGEEDYYDSSFGAALERIVNSGVNLAMAAGNDYNAAMCNAWSETDIVAGSFTAGGYNLVENPDSGVVGSPSTWPEGISVAAVKNAKAQGYYFSVESINYGYTENEENPVKFRTALGGQTVEYVMVPGVGTVEDFAQVNVQGKIALVQRGSINFTEKAANAENAGAVACVVYNNVANEQVNMVAYEGGRIPHIAISKETGDALAAAANKQMTVAAQAGIYDAVGGDMPSDFSSWGCTTTLGMKPEITAPGGQIYSSTDPAISGALYQAWDGTSMATPHIAGGMAIISEYVKDNFPNLSTREQHDLVNCILMSTATPVIDKGGDYALVRDQGAGEMNLAKAVTTTAYITVEGTEGNRPKIELGDDPQKTGSYTLTFTVHNFGTTELKYTVQPSVLLNDLTIIGYADEAQQEPIIAYTETGYDLAKDNGMVTFDKPQTVVVPAGGQTEVTVTINLTADAKEYIDQYYTSGSFIEGFIELMPATSGALLGDADGDGQIKMADAVLVMRAALGLITLSDDVNVDMDGDGQIKMADAVLIARTALGLIDAPTKGANDGVSLTVPYLGYYGDWNYAETIDFGYYYQDVQLNSNNYPNTAGYKKGNTIQGLGINPFVDPGDLEYYLADRNAISPNGDGVLDTLNLVYTGLLRQANVRYVVIDPATGNELGVISNAGLCNKGFFDTNRRVQLGVNQGVFPGGFNFTQYNKSDIIVRVEAKLNNDGRHGTNAFTTDASKNWKWDIPVHIDTTAPSVSNFSAANGKFNFTVTDEHYVAYAAVYTNNNGALGSLVERIGIFEQTRGANTQVSLNGSTNNIVVVGDYAGNVSAYLWNGSSLTQIEVGGGGLPSGSYQDASIYGYGANLQEMQWLFTLSTDITSVYYGEVNASLVSVDAAGYDRAHSTCYEFTQGTIKKATLNPNNGRLSAWTNVGSTNGLDFNEMAYDNAHGILFGVSGAMELYTIDTATAACEKIADIQNGVIAMDFNADGVLFYVDAYGMLCSVDLYSDNPTINEIADIGIAPVDMNTGSFFSQSGCMYGNTFYWGSITPSQSKTLVRIDTTNGAFEEMGVIMQDPGLQLTGMFAIELYDLGNYQPTAFSGQMVVAD